MVGKSWVDHLKGGVPSVGKNATEAVDDEREQTKAEKREQERARRQRKNEELRQKKHKKKVAMKHTKELNRARRLQGQGDSPGTGFSL